MNLSGENYYLDEIQEFHIDNNYLGWLNDKEINKFLEIRFYEQNLESAKKYINSFKSNEEKKLWGIFYKQNKKLVGTVNLTNINLFHETCMVNIMVGDKEHWGKSAASEGIKLALEFASKKLKMRKVLASTYAENMSINFTLKNLGFSIEGKLEKNRKLENNLYSDEFKWGIFLDN